MAHHQISARDEQKQRTRRALLDAALRLLEDETLASLSLRALTREVGIVPAAFYRHFRDIPDLGVALVAESLGALREVLTVSHDPDLSMQEGAFTALTLLASHVEAHRGHYRFIARELFGSLPQVRAAIRGELATFASELAEKFAERPEMADWPPDELLRFAGTVVDLMVLTAGHLLEVPDGDQDQANEILSVSGWRLAVLNAGRERWLAGQ
jgi:AcrR family transcriptional regulator